MNALQCKRSLIYGPVLRFGVLGLPILARGFWSFASLCVQNYLHLHRLGRGQVGDEPLCVLRQAGYDIKL